MGTQHLTVQLADLTDDFTADPYSAFAALRVRGAVHHVRFPTGDESWLVVGHEEVRAAFVDPRLRNDVRHSADFGDDGLYSVGLNMLQVDPPDHTRLRTLVAREFTARRVQALRPRVREAAGALLDDVAAARRADLVAAYAYPLPLTVICELLGVPDMDRAAFREWSTKVVALDEPEESARAAREMAAYLAELAEGKRRLRDAAESDLLHALVRDHDGDADDRLTPEELLGMAFLLLVAGHETTVNLIANAVHLLLGNPGQLAALHADPELLAGAVEETLRFESPVPAGTYRYTAEPVELGGARIPAGARVVLSIAAANRDPARFPDPDRFDIHRDAASTRAHLAFGYGLHHCLGAPLARLEANLALRVLLDRFPGLAFDGDGAPRWRTSLMRSLHDLPVRW
ncbi:cytochrome P450 family protein [Streptomyces sp. CBMA29]|uniref:cytochrome P450 family protein n=1 Tax=Streptomyces sp. CBMA29 TaxID=1896314 RepID=UPI001661937B|nr:cytochrome P450 [Streptomyces sp. CBMA29]MBD0738613.1 cytochrome [Streptomyces sp. CBMA29]